MFSRTIVLILTLGLIGAAARAADDGPKPEPGGKIVITVAMESGEKKEIVALTPKRQQEIIAKLSTSLVRVEYTLKFDKGEPPGGGYSAYGDDREYMGDGDEHIREERPMEVPGFLIGERHVVADAVVVFLVHKAGQRAHGPHGDHLEITLLPFGQLNCRPVSVERARRAAFRDPIDELSAVW